MLELLLCILSQISCFALKSSIIQGEDTFSFLENPSLFVTLGKKCEQPRKRHFTLKGNTAGEADGIEELISYVDVLHQITICLLDFIGPNIKTNVVTLCSNFSLYFE